jgi:hypothetical protein
VLRLNLALMRIKTRRLPQPNQLAWDLSLPCPWAVVHRQHLQPPARGAKVEICRCHIRTWEGSSSPEHTRIASQTNPSTVE